MLTLEYAPGTKITDTAGIVGAGLDAPAVARRATERCGRGRRRVRAAGRAGRGAPAPPPGPPPAAACCPFHSHPACTHSLCFSAAPTPTPCSYLIQILRHGFFHGESGSGGGRHGGAAWERLGKAGARPTRVPNLSLKPSCYAAPTLCS